MLKYRVLTALVLLPLLIGLVWFLPIFYFSMVVAVLLGWSAWEWSALIGLQTIYDRIAYVLLLEAGIYFVIDLPTLPLLSFALLLWLWALLAVYCYSRDQPPAGFQRQPVQALFGFVVLVACWVSLVTVRLSGGGGHFGAVLLLLGLCIVFAADTGAYCVGRLWGKHALAPRLSPKKTWEGLVGGVLAALLVGLLGSVLLLHTGQQRLLFCALSVVVALFSTVGDLTVSLLKRQSGLKDSGFLLPGHGGLLDRIDSVAAGIVVFALGIMVFSA